MDHYFRSMLTEGEFGRGRLFHGSLTEGEFWARPGDECVVLYRSKNTATFDPWWPTACFSFSWTGYVPLDLTLTLDAEDFDTGDYAVLYSNGGTGSVDFTGDPHDATVIPLDSPWSGGDLDVPLTIATPGAWAFGFNTYDAAGNLTPDTPGEASTVLYPTPYIPGIVITSYTPPVLVITVDATAVNIPHQHIVPDSGQHQWFYTARAVGGDGRASDYSNVDSIVVFSDGATYSHPGDIPGDQAVAPAIGGRFEVRWTYYGDVEPTGFEVEGTYGIDPYLSGGDVLYSGNGHYSWVSPVFPHGTVTEWIVRAYTTSGETRIRTNNFETFAATADAVGPAAIETVALTIQ